MSKDTMGTAEALGMLGLVAAKHGSRINAIAEKSQTTLHEVASAVYRRICDGEHPDHVILDMERKCGIIARGRKAGRGPRQEIAPTRGLEK